MRATSFASMDTPGPFETKATEAYYYVTPVEPDWPPQQKEEWLTAFNYYTTDIVSIHEAYPGPLRPIPLPERFARQQAGEDLQQLRLRRRLGALRRADDGG